MGDAVGLRWTALLVSPIFSHRMYGCTDGNLEKDAKMKSHSNSDVSLFYLLGGYYMQQV